MSKIYLCRIQWLDEWSEAFFITYLHASELCVEWISQLLIKAQQLYRATDKAAVYAFICKLVLERRRKSRCTALLCRHAWGVRRCWDWVGKDRTLRLHIYHFHPSSPSLPCFPPPPHPLLLFLFSDHAWLQTAVAQMAQDPENAKCRLWVKPHWLFTRDLSGVCRIKVLQLRSEKAQKCIIVVSIISFTNSGGNPLNYSNNQKTCNDWSRALKNPVVAPSRHQREAEISKDTDFSRAVIS